MNDITSKTLLLLLTLSFLTFFSCGTTSKSYTDYTKNRSYKPSSSKNRTYSHTLPSKPKESKKRTSKSRSTSKSKSASTGRTSVSLERQNLVDYAKTLEGIAYIYGGKSEMGFDCSGFTSHVYRKQGKALTGNSVSQASQGQRIPLKYAKAGDLLIFGSTQKISHVAIIAEHTSNKLVIVHASSSKGVTTQDITNSSYWQPKILYAVDVLDKQTMQAKGSYSKE